MSNPYSANHTNTSSEHRAEAFRIEAASKKAPAKEALVQTVWGQHNDDRDLSTRDVKVKQKTRPEIPSAERINDRPAMDNDLASDLADLNIHTINVDSRTRDLFAQMYDTTSETPGNVDWDDFVAAMVDTGFSVAPGGGSVFTFKHLTDGGRINFHRPHPDPMVDPIMLRTMGKRLNKWFRFCKETFVERKEENGVNPIKGR